MEIQLKNKLYAIKIISTHKPISTTYSLKSKEKEKSVPVSFFPSERSSPLDFLCLAFFLTGLEKSKSDMPILNDDNLSKAPPRPKSFLVKEIDVRIIMRN
jgi:hypothetical protein